MIEMYKARCGMTCAECASTDTIEIVSPVYVTKIEAEHIGFIIECNDCEKITYTYPF